MKDVLHIAAIITLPLWAVPLLIVSILLMAANIFATFVFGKRIANWMFAYIPD